MPVLSTYRLQLHAGFRLADARALVPYIRALGATHVYSSPLLRARSGSTHGYDVTDPTRLNPELGEPADLERLTEALGEAAMGLLLDIVPNHVAATEENPFWEDVLAHGRLSRYAHWFDIDWDAGEGRTAGKLLMPILGDWFGHVLEAGELAVAREHGRFRVRYDDRSFPLDPATVPRVLAPVRDALERRLGREHRHVRDLEDGLAALRSLPSDPEARARVSEAALGRLEDVFARSSSLRRELRQRLRELNGADGRGRLRILLDAQPYALVHWRRAREEVNYRRFFDINELAGVRVELPEVFAATHPVVLGWVGEGRLAGLRVDHPDGLLDPGGYLERLRDEVARRRGERVAEPPGSFPVYVEKILSPGERLPAEWPVAGTTGYEFLNRLEAVFLNPAGVRQVDEAYRALVGRSAGFAEAARRGKRLALTGLLATDVQRLALRLRRIARRDPSAAGLRLPDLASAIVEMIVHLPVYRTYVNPREGGIRPQDREWIARALAGARGGGRAAAAALDLLEQVLLLEPGGAGDAGERLRFVQRFQQTSGPATAKGVEDTALYVHVPLVSLNEVGGDPGAPLDGALEELHQANAERARRWPGNLLCTTTHDTKRSADVRARLDVLSELPAEWLARVGRWRRLNRRHRRPLGGRLSPDANTEYLLYQTLVGVWPLPEDTPAGGAAGNAAQAPPIGGVAALRERVQAYMLKAAREAKAHTSWLDPDPAFEGALEGFVRALLPDGGETPFLADLAEFVGGIRRAGLWNALARTLVHLTAPGVPDLYQGDELWSFTLVDPDNRRPVDFASRASMLEGVRAAFGQGLGGHEAAQRPAPGSVPSRFLRTVVEWPEDGRIKLHVVHRGLVARSLDPELFLSGAYEPLWARGQRARHVFAFARRKDGRAAVVAVPRLTLSLPGGGAAPLGEAVWGDTRLPLPAGWGEREWSSALTGGRISAPGGTLRIAEALRELPVALLCSA